MAKLTTTIELQLGQFKKELADTRKALREGTGDADELKKKIKELEDKCKNSSTELYGLKKATDSAKKGFGDLRNAVEGFDGSFGSFKGIAAALGNAKKEFAALKAASGSTGAALANMAGVGGGVGSALSAIVSPAGLAVAALAGVGAVCLEGVKRFEDFKTSLNDLQALTGMTDEQMGSIADGIIEVSNSTGKSAKDIAASMGLIGSQAPELLKVPESLLKVTEAANILAQAAGIAAEDAAKGITTIMNQLGVSANEASNIVNALAAGQANGAASVEYLNKAIEKSGSQAKAAGMDYHELISVIESIAPKFSSADVAGSQLNSTLLKLSMGADEFNPAVVGMKTALENLSRAELDNAGLKDMVGESNVSMVKALIESKDAIEDFKAGITDTNAAWDQANVKTKGMNAAIDNLSNAWDNFLLTIGGSDALQGVVEDLSDAVNAVADALKWASQHTEAIVEYVKLIYSPLDVVFKLVSDIVDWIRNGGSATERLKKLFEDLLTPLRRIQNIWASITGSGKPSAAASASGTTSTRAPETPSSSDPTGTDEEGGKGGKVKGKVDDGSAALKRSERELRIAEINAIQDKDERERKLLDERHRQKMEDIKEEYDAAKNDNERLAAMNKMDAENVGYRTSSAKLDEKTGARMGELKVKPELDTIDTKGYIEQKMEEIGPATYEIEVQVGTEKAMVAINGLGNCLQNMGNTLANVGQITDNSGFQVAGIIANAVANLLKGYSAATAEAGTMGPWAWAAFALSGLAEVTSVVAQVKSLGKYASGGIVEGASMVGDMNLARVNAGEMILNGQQQANLFRQLNQPSAEQDTDRKVEFKITGKTLVGVLENQRRSGRM